MQAAKDSDRYGSHSTTIYSIGVVVGAPCMHPATYVGKSELISAGADGVTVVSLASAIVCVVNHHHHLAQPHRDTHRS